MFNFRLARWRLELNTRIQNLLMCGQHEFPADTRFACQLQSIKRQHLHQNFPLTILRSIAVLELSGNFTRPFFGYSMPPTLRASSTSNKSIVQLSQRVHGCPAAYFACINQLRGVRRAIFDRYSMQLT